MCMWREISKGFTTKNTKEEHKKHKREICVFCVLLLCFLW
jgi:hypothetical protein